MSQTATIAGDSTLRIVYVHGLGFQPAASEYLDSVVDALRSGLVADRKDGEATFDRLNHQIAWYADLTNAMLSAAGQTYDELLDISDRRNALQSLKGLSRKKGFGVAHYDRLPGKSALSEFAATIGAPLLSALGLQKKVVAQISSEMGEYWQKGGDYRQQVRDRVRSAVTDAFERGEHVMMIAHGAGSIISYDVLWQLSHEPDYAQRYETCKIEALVTTGSPLANNMVRRQLLGADRKGRERYPTNILAWHNLAAEDDFISHDGTMANDFRPMLRQRQISSIRDYRIYNLAVRYGKSAPHCLLGFLIHPRMATIVGEWMTRALEKPLPHGLNAANNPS